MHPAAFYINVNIGDFIRILTFCRSDKLRAIVKDTIFEVRGLLGKR